MDGSFSLSLKELNDKKVQSNVKTECIYKCHRLSEQRGVPEMKASEDKWVWVFIWVCSALPGDYPPSLSVLV